MNDFILEAKNLTVIYGRNKQAAEKMIRAREDKMTIQKQTGCTVALRNVSFQVKQSEIFVIIGLSGCGKSTLIRCFNQLLKPTRGNVMYQGISINEMNKKEIIQFRRSKASMVFQNFGLFTHKTVLENVAYGLEIRGKSKTERLKEAMNVIQMTGLEGWENKAIRSLSGGMKQRVGIARALANNPEVLLMDEPFSALDPLVRRDMQFELLSIQRKLGKTIVFITHDINEAFKLGDTVAILRDGEIVQIDTPVNMSNKPANLYVKNFIQGADKSQFLNAGHVMATPTCLIRMNEAPVNAIREMQKAGFSSAYVIDDKMHFVGILSIEDALKAKQNQQSFKEYIHLNCLTVEEHTLLNELMPLALSTKFPIAVVNKEKILRGIISKASVIASLI